MSANNQYVSSEYSTRTYYILTNTFRRPIEFKLSCTYNSQVKAKEAFEIAFWPCKVYQFIEPKPGLSYMESAEVFTETGECI